MCLLWILIQFAVVFMYWDLPPLQRGKETLKSKCSDMVNEQRTGEEAEDEDEEDEDEIEDEEVKPLMQSQELAGSYGSAAATESHRNVTTATPDATLNQTSPSPEPPVSHESPSPFKNFSLSRGGCYAVVGIKCTLPLKCEISVNPQQKLGIFPIEWKCEHSKISQIWRKSTGFCLKKGNVRTRL